MDVLDGEAAVLLVSLTVACMYQMYRKYPNLFCVQNVQRSLWKNWDTLSLVNLYVSASLWLLPQQRAEHTQTKQWHVICPPSNCEKLNIPATILCFDSNVPEFAACIIHINSESRLLPLYFMCLSVQGYSICILHGCCSVLRALLFYCPQALHCTWCYYQIRPVHPYFIPTFFSWSILKD